MNYASSRADWEKIAIADESEGLKGADVYTGTERTNAIIIFAVIVAVFAVAIVVLIAVKKKRKKAA